MPREFTSKHAQTAGDLGFAVMLKRRGFSLYQLNSGRIVYRVTLVEG